MPLPPFQESSANFAEPWCSLVQNMHQRLDDFSNVVVLGNYPSDEQVTMEAWTIVGMAPESHNLPFLHCSLTFGGEHNEAKWFSQVRDVISRFSEPPPLARLPPPVLGAMIQDKLGKDKFHVVGAITHHRAAVGTKECIVLWMNPGLNQESIEYVLKIILNERLQ